MALLSSVFSAAVSVCGIVEFRVLGLLNVADSGRSVTIGRGKESEMLAFLLVNANQPVSADLLIDGLWEERPPANAAKTIQIYVSRLRGRLGRERILTTPAGYLLRVEAEELDASSFERLAAEGRSLLEAGNAARAESVLSEALDLWRGEALADFRFNGFAQAEIGRLQERRASALADRIDARLALGHAEEVIPELEVLVREQPLWERPRRQLMLALYQRRASSRCPRAVSSDALAAGSRARPRSQSGAASARARDPQPGVRAREAAATADTERRRPIGRMPFPPWAPSSVATPS